MKVQKHFTLASLMKAQKERIQNGVESADEAVEKLAGRSHNDMVDLTTGNIPKNFLDAVHPFARGESAANNYAKGGNVGRRRVDADAAKLATGKRVVPLRPINRHTGDLRNSIRLDRPKKKTYDLSIGEGVPYARFILHPAGTKLMVGRGVMGWRKMFARFPMGEIEKRFRARMSGIKAAIREGHRKNV